MKKNKSVKSRDKINMSFAYAQAKAPTKAPEKRDSVVSHVKNESSRPANSPVNHILQLQETVGNQAVQRLIGRGAIRAKLDYCRSNDNCELDSGKIEANSNLFLKSRLSTFPATHRDIDSTDAGESSRKAAPSETSKAETAHPTGIISTRVDKQKLHFGAHYVHRLKSSGKSLEGVIINEKVTTEKDDFDPKKKGVVAVKLESRKKEKCPPVNAKNEIGDRIWASFGTFVYAINRLRRKKKLGESLLGESVDHQELYYWNNSNPIGWKKFVDVKIEQRLYDMPGLLVLTIDNGLWADQEEFTPFKPKPEEKSERKLSNAEPIKKTKQSADYVIQPKLMIGPANDIYEQEADKVAEQITRMPQPNLQTQNRKGARIKSKYLFRQIAPSAQMLRKEEKNEHNRGKALPNSSLEIPSDLEVRIQSLKGAGQPLPNSARAFFESFFGYDLSSVRIHIGAPASELTMALRADAFTTKENVVFGSNQYDTETRQGRLLLAHELTHVVQQRQSFGNALTVQRQAKGPKITFKVGMKVIEHPDGKLEVEVVKPWKTGSGLASTYLGMARVAGIDPKLLASELVNSGAYKSLDQVRRLFFVGTRIFVRNGKIMSISTRGKGYEVVEKAWELVRLPDKIVFYPQKPSDPTETILGWRAEKIHEKHKVPIEKIKSIYDVFEFLDKIPEKHKELSGVKSVEPFISELLFLGHGHSGMFKFGETYCSIEDLKKIKSGKAERHLKPNALVKLDGCKVAAAPYGEQFMCEVGRVFFGNKPGRIWGNTGNVVPSDSYPNAPITIKWPDCKKKIRLDESLGIP
jgi:hypothetical protein